MWEIVHTLRGRLCSTWEIVTLQHVGDCAHTTWIVAFFWLTRFVAYSVRTRSRRVSSMSPWRDPRFVAISIITRSWHVSPVENLPRAYITFVEDLPRCDTASYYNTVRIIRAATGVSDAYSNDVVILLRHLNRLYHNTLLQSVTTVQVSTDGTFRYLICMEDLHITSTAVNYTVDAVTARRCTSVDCLLPHTRG